MGDPAFLCSDRLCRRVYEQEGGRAAPGVLFIIDTPDPIARGRVLGRNQRQLEALRRILTSLSAIHGLGAQIAVR
ncbi:MAG TPA: hypothetical protein VKM54_00590 [Myxococcota bacterium]|nr:hypothetical protein [Myxococcota bacterium]